MHPTRIFLLLAALSAVAVAPVLAQERDREPPEGEEETPARAAREEPRAGGEFEIDEQLADDGEMLFMNKGCSVCHGIGQGRLAGPDLRFVTRRRDVEWIRRFVRDPRAMVRTDETAAALVRGYNNIIMPDLGLHESQITALLHYLAREDRDAMEETTDDPS